ncbi:MAG: ABC transporter ATP-binding protein [Microvirgula sp.]
MTDPIALSARDLCYRISRKPILQDISLDIPAGSISALLGPNGAGKTTLLKLLAGLRSPSSGVVRIDGIAVSSIPPAERARTLAFVPQHIPDGIPLSVFEFIALGRVPHLGAFGRLAAEDRNAVCDALETVELGDKAEVRLDTLSGGERQRAAIARALAQSAPILLLDEPTNHLDLRHQHRLQQLLVRLAESGKTVIEVLHDLALAANYADHVVLIDHGRLVADGRPEQVMREDCLRAVYECPLRLVRHAPRGWHMEMPQAA